jgi:integrase
MASILKKPGSRSPFWFAAYRGADGRRMQKSTRTTDRKLAFKLAMEWEGISAKGKQGALVEAQVRRVVSEIVEQATGEVLHFAKAADYFTDWLKSKEHSTSKATFAKYKQGAREFVDSLGARAALPLNAIGSPDVNRFKETLLGKGLTPSSVNNLLKVISAAFEKARKQGLRPDNPVEAVDRLRDAEKDHVDPFTAEQVRSLIQSADGDWKGFILLAAYTGLRLMDTVRLTWGNLNFEAGTLKTKLGKVRTVLEIDLHPDFLRWLDFRPRGLPCAPLLPDLAAQKQSTLSKGFARIMRAAGIQGRMIREARGSAGRSRSSLTEHSLRHTFISGLANTGTPIDLRKELAGHADEAVHKLYTHHDSERRRAAIQALPNYL